MPDVCRVSRHHCLGFLCASADPLTGTSWLFILHERVAVQFGAGIWLSYRVTATVVVSRLLGPAALNGSVQYDYYRCICNHRYIL